MKETAKEFHIKVFSVDDSVTIAWVRNFEGAKMITVSTSYFDLNEQDKFRSSTGKYFALKRLFGGSSAELQFIQLPLGRMNDDYITGALTDKFDM